MLNTWGKHQCAGPLLPVTLRDKSQGGDDHWHPEGLVPVPASCRRTRGGDPTPDPSGPHVELCSGKRRSTPCRPR